MGQSVGQGASGLAHRMLGNERGLSGRSVRYSRRRAGSDLSASRERARAVALRARHVCDGELLDAQRLPGSRRQEDVEERRQLRDDQGIAGDKFVWRTKMVGKYSAS